MNLNEFAALTLHNLQYDRPAQWIEADGRSRTSDSFVYRAHYADGFQCRFTGAIAALANGRATFADTYEAIGRPTIPNGVEK